MYQFLPLDKSEVFQNFVCDLFDHIYSGESFQTFGRNGHKQKGIDVFSSEHKIVIQCKKKDIINRKEITLINELKNEIESESLKTRNENLQIEFSEFIIASTYKDNPDLQEYCSIIKQKHNYSFDIKYYGWDTISRKLENHPNLIQKYYSKFNLTSYYISAEDQVKQKLEMKRRFEKGFVGIHLKRVIIKKSTENDYPVVNDIPNGQISSWFRVNLWNYYHNGIEIIISANHQIIEDEEGYWDILDLGDPRKAKYQNVKSILWIGQIPYSNIVDFNLVGDDIFSEPHIYCHFKNNGEPYESYEYLEKLGDDSRGKPSYYPLNKSKRKALK